MSAASKDSRNIDVSSDKSLIKSKTPSQELDWVTSAMSGSDEVVLLEGDMASADSSPSKVNLSSSSSSKGLHLPQLNLDTLDEPISETLMRDLKGIITKVKHVILPTSKSSAYKSVLKDWDLWVSQT